MFRLTHRMASEYLPFSVADRRKACANKLNRNHGYIEGGGDADKTFAREAGEAAEQETMATSARSTYHVTATVSFVVDCVRDVHVFQRPTGTSKKVVPVSDLEYTRLIVHNWRTMRKGHLFYDLYIHCIYM